MKTVAKNLLVLLVLASAWPVAAQVDGAPLRALTISATEFQPTNSSVVVRGHETIRSASANGDVLVADVDLPDGAQIVSWELNYCRNDETAGNISMEFDEICENDDSECYVQGFGEHPGSSFSVVGCAKSVGGVNSPGLIRPVDNSNREYLVYAHFSGKLPNEPVGNVYIRNFRIFYRMATAPPPETPTFADVPANHFFYQAIEAMAASGVTQGCAPNQFCPERPVTRAEIAAFLARALGLGWTKP